MVIFNVHISESGETCIVYMDGELKLIQVERPIYYSDAASRCKVVHFL